MAEPKESNALGDIGRVLAAALREEPWLSFVGLFGVLGCIACVGFAATTDSLWPLPLLFAFLLILVGVGWVGFQRKVARQSEMLTIESVDLHEKSAMQLAHELSETRKSEVRAALREAASAAAMKIGVDEANVRANIFALDSDGKLRIIPEFSHNMKRPLELSISFSPKEGVAGAAFQRRRVVFAQYEPKWGSFAIPDTELAKADPRLRWIVSYPVVVDDNVPWVINVDGLDDDLSEETLRVVVVGLAPWNYLLALLLSGREEEPRP